MVLLKQLTKSNNVSDQAKDSKVEATVLNILSTTEDQGDGDRAGIAHGQENDTNTRKGIVRSSGAKVDHTEKNFNDHSQ